MSSASGEPIADSVRHAWPAEAASIAKLQRRFWATQWPAELAELMLASVSLTEMTESWLSAIERPPQAAFRVLVATDGTRAVGFATTMPSQDDDADPSTEARSISSLWIRRRNIEATVRGCSTPARTHSGPMALAMPVAG